MSAQPTAPLAGVTVVVTGGNRGLGLAMARGVAKAGADVVIWARSVDRTEAVATELAELGVRTAAIRCDVTNEDDVVSAAAETIDRFGHIDAAFANAGVLGARAKLVDISLEQWRLVHTANLEGVLLTFRECARHMLASGRPGALIGMSSLSVTFGSPRYMAYAASKGGVEALCRSIAVELAPHGIRCNSLRPGWIDTDMQDHGDDRLQAATIARTPVRRWGTPDELEGAAVFLADPAQRFHTGTEIVIDGGYSIF